MKKSIHIGLLTLIALSVFVFCLTSEANCSTVAPYKTSQDADSFINNIGTLRIRYSGPGVQPCGPGSGGGQGPSLIV